MLIAYSPQDGRLVKTEIEGTEFPMDPVWVDMLYPTPDEAWAVRKSLKVDLPTHEEMQEIELSSRLYSENGSLFMTATLISQTETDNPEAKPATFVLSGDRLITMRYSEATPFRQISLRLQRPGSGAVEATSVLARLLDAIVDRIADVLERIATEVDSISREIFEHDQVEPSISTDYQEILKRIGRKGDLNSKARESLVSVGRLLTFVTQKLDARIVDPQLRAQFTTMGHDVHALTDHASFLSNKINFLLDATLGMINIEQNAIIKIFSVAAVVFLPPTLIASIYGMNFRIMPELGWHLGYPFALILMVISAILPWWYFKRRGWL